MKLTIPLLITAAAFAQSPSGLLTGPVTFTDPLTQSPYGGPNYVYTFQDGSHCTNPPNALGVNPTCPFIVRYVVGAPYAGLVADDGTGNCYTWDVWQLDTGACQTSFHGGGMGEYGALYASDTVSSDDGTTYTFNAVMGWDGTAITVINGVDAPIQTLYNAQLIVKHHPVYLQIKQFRGGVQIQKWQVIDSFTLVITPQPPAASTAVDGGPSPYIVDGPEPYVDGGPSPYIRKISDDADDRNTFFHPDRNWKGKIRGDASIYIWCFLACVDACDNTSYPGDCDPLCNQVCIGFQGNPGAAPSLDKEVPMVGKPRDLWNELWAESRI